MWLRFVNSKWFERLFTAAIAIIAVLLTQKIVSGREQGSSIQNQLSIRPTYDYVNQQDKNIINYVDQHVDESTKANDVLMGYIKSMDGKIDILLNKR